MIKRCNCTHPYQDKVYGKGMRVHNEKDKTPNEECTVCGSITFITRRGRRK